MSLESSLNLKLFEFDSNIREFEFGCHGSIVAVEFYHFVHCCRVLTRATWEHCTIHSLRDGLHYWSPLCIFHVDISLIDGSDGYDWFRLTGDIVAVDGVLLLLLLGLLFAVLLLGLLLLLLALFSVLVRFWDALITSSACAKCCRGPGSGV